MASLTAATLFSGIGGADLGLQRAGFSLLWQCERDPYRRAILMRNFGVLIYRDAENLPTTMRVECPDLLFIDPENRRAEAFDLAWPILARLRPPMLAIQATSESFAIFQDRLTALGYTGLVFGLHQEITRLDFLITKMQPFVLAWSAPVAPLCFQAQVQAALPSRVGDQERDGGTPRSVIEIMELLMGFPRRWSCECQGPDPIACRETSERLVALNHATDPALAEVVAVAARRLLAAERVEALA